MKRIDSIEQALQQAEKLQFVMVTELSRVVIGKMPMDINWDELIEARFFDHDTEIRIFRENGELRARSVILQDDMPYIEKQYNKLQGNLGSKISVREYLTFDEDGQAGVSAVCLYDWRNDEWRRTIPTIRRKRWKTPFVHHITLCRLPSVSRLCGIPM